MSTATNTTAPPTIEFTCADCLAWMRDQPADRYDLVFGSPPYCDARTYGIGAQRDCAAWVEWMLDITEAAARICRGPVVWVAAGVTRQRNYWPACEGLMWEWWKRGGEHHLYRPVYWNRVGIPGSGGDDWFRADVEYCMCFKRPGALSWSDNTAMGHAPKYAPGGEMSHRAVNGERVNRDKWGSTNNNRGCNGRRANGTHKASGRKIQTRRKKDGSHPGSHGHDGMHNQEPVLANPGNLLRIPVGGGLMGNPLAHENEAPFPERLAEFFVRSLCPPKGVVLDPFSGSGTTAAVCQRLGRGCTGVDIRASQIRIAKKRVAQQVLF